MVTLDDAMDHLGIDYPDPMITKNVTQALATAMETLKGAVGKDVEDLMPDSSRADRLVLIYLDDLYSEKGVSTKVSGATRLLVASMVLQLQCELQILREEAGA